MKFGKELLNAAESCKLVVAPECWLDYKLLKKMLKYNPMEEQPLDSPTSPQLAAQNQRQRIIRSQVERRFFLALQSELTKVDTRYHELKMRAVDLANAFLSQPPLRQAPLERIRACADVHLFLLVVKNFSVLNYCGFKKILKKHDKLRGVTTKDSYMVRVVNQKSFAQFEEFRELLQHLELHYTFLASLVPKQSQMLFETQRKEMEKICVQGNDRLRSLAKVASNAHAEGNSRLLFVAAPLPPPQVVFKRARMTPELAFEPIHNAAAAAASAVTSSNATTTTTKEYCV